MAAAVKAAHRIVRVVAVALAIGVPVWLLRAPADRPPVDAIVPVTIRPAPAGVGPAAFPADGGDATGAAGASGGPPVPVGIVGRLPSDVQALVRQGDGRIRTMIVGDAADGWTLAGIEPDRLRFRRGDQERVLTLPIVEAGADAPATDQ